MSSSSTSRGLWAVAKSAKKPRKEDADEASGAFPTSPHLHGSLPRGDGMFEAALQTEAMLQGRLSTSLPASHPLQEDFGTLERPEEQDPRTVAEAARAFTSLRVHIPDSQQPGAPASPADLPGAVPSQPHSPKKRKAAGSLHHEESSMVSGSDAGNGGSDGEGELGVGREGSDGPGQAPLAGGTMGDLLHQFGQIELNRDLLEAIKRTESQTGAPRQWYDREVDRAAFDAAVSAAQAVLLQQLGELETELTGGKGGGSEEERRNIAADSVSELLQVYALPTIAVFAAEDTSTEEVTLSGTDPDGSRASGSVGPPLKSPAPPPTHPPGPITAAPVSFPINIPAPRHEKEKEKRRVRSREGDGVLSPATSARGPRNAEKRQHIGDGPEGGFSPGGAEEAVVLLMERSLKTFDPEDDAEGPDAIIREAHAGHGPPAVPMPVPAVPAGSGADVSGASGELRRHRAVPGKGSCGSLGQNRTSSTLPDADACAEAVAGDADATSMPVTSPPDLTARQDSTPAEVDSLINALSPRAGIAHAASRGKGASSPGDVAPQAGGWGAVGGREKRDPRPSSSGEPSRLSNDPPKRQRKGADLVIQVAARQSRGQDDEEVTPVQSQISPVEEVALIQGQRLPLGKMMQSSVEEEPQVQHSVQENAGGRDGGGAAEAVQKGQGVVSHGAVGVEEPLHAAERAGDNSRRRVPTDNERGTGHSHSFEGHSGAGGPPVGAASSRGGALEAQEGGSAEGAGAAAWGSSLVCADLTIHEVGSHYRPGSIPGALHIKKRPLSATTQQRVSALAAALGDAIVAAYADAGKPGRVHPGIKSLVAAAAFDDLLRERAAAAEVAGATSDGAQRQGREGSRSESGESEGAGESDVGGHDDFHDR